MADVETKKGRGRPVAKAPVKAAVVEEEPKKRATAENGDAPVAKRGRGRPPKKSSPKKLAGAGGRGRPPAKSSPAKKKSDDDEEEEDDESS